MDCIDTIIIGGGVSGMACGRTLHANGKEFVLLTKEVGGRMLTSQSHLVNYGASYVTSDYENVLPLMGGAKPIRPSECYFFHHDRLTSFYSLRTLHSSPALLRLQVVVRDFRFRLRKLRRQALHEQQMDILAADPVLTEHVNTPARVFVEKHGLEELNDLFFGPLFHSTGFIEYDRSNAFHYLDNLMPLVCRTYVADHSRCCEDMPKGWRDRIRIEGVNALAKEPGGGFLVRTEKASYHAQHVVLALPYKEAVRFWPVPNSGHNIPIHVIELAGERKPPFCDEGIVFFRPGEHDITILWKQVTGSDVIFSKTSEPALGRYYSRYRIIRRIHWETAAVLSGDTWVPQDLGGGLYLASDYNICGLEDAFITGVYAANRIVNGT